MISAGSTGGAGYYAGGGGDDYARDASGRNYYTGAVDKGERPGFWSGALAERLGLVGVVAPKDMETVYETFRTPDGQPIGNGARNYTTAAERLAVALEKEPDALPERIEELRLSIERDTHSTYRGIDLTAGVPKSVTVAYVAAWHDAEQARSDGQSARSDGHSDDADGYEARAVGYEATRAALDAAILSANQTALDGVAGVATTRVGKHGSGYAGRWVDAPNLVVASFPQLTSRSGDPHYHVHNVVLNRAATEGGKIGALDTVDLRQQRHGFSAKFDRALAEELGAMGVRVGWTSHEREDGWRNWEIKGIDQEALDSFSQRRAQITKAMAPVVAAQEEKLGRDLNNRERARIAQTINLITRETKDKGDIDWSEKLAGWTEQLTDDIGMGLSPIAAQIHAMVEDGTPVPVAAFSPEAVISQALYELATKSATWNRADAYLAIDQGLPAQLGVTPEAADRITEGLVDRLLATEGVVQVGGTRGLEPPASLMEGTFVRPSDAVYAAPETLEAENLILRAAVERGRGPTAEMGPKALEAWRGQVNAWLNEHYPTIQPDQRAAVVGLASTDAVVAQLVGPAGTGKSFTDGALAGVWAEMTGGRMIGLTTSKVASEVLREDGVPLTFTMAAWRAMEWRIASGNLRGDEITLTDRDILLIDEASMVKTSDLSMVRAAADRAGGRMVPTGDPAQLGAPGAGGGMGLLEAGGAETYTLTDVRRFSAEWERDASLGLRSGSLDALREYDLHGRFVEVETMDDALTAAARAAAAAWLEGKSVSVTADTNANAYRLADLVRGHLVAAGAVDEEGMILDRGDQVAGLGDQVITRQIDYTLGVLNGSRFEVIGTGDDGALSVRAEDGTVRELPADYVSANVQLGYASTVHLSQGRTVDVGFTVTGGNASAAALYVGMTRGRDGNHAFVALDAGADDDRAPGIEGPQAKPSAVSVLAGAMQRETESRAALMEQRADIERNASMDTLMGRIEETTHLACRARLDGDLDRLVEDGVLGEGDRARLCADDSTDHLSRVCRAAEQAGMDPALVLREAIQERELHTAKSVAQVIADRITSEHDVAGEKPGGWTVPDRVPEDVGTYLGRLHAAAEDRAHDLGARAVEDQPGWAVKELGPVPDDAFARLEWEARAGTAAAFREAKGLEDGDERTLTPMPGLSQPEAGAAWAAAYEALGRPSETRVEAALTDGALQARVAAWQREQEWAPAHANASLRQAHLDAEHARQEAILARAVGDGEAAEKWDRDAHDRQAVADAMEVVSDARGEWAGQTAVTQDLAERAAAELKERGREPGHERDRVTAEEWLEHQREVDAREEAAKEVTDLDVPLVDDSTVVDAAEVEAEDEDTDVSGETQETQGSAHSSEESGHDEPTPDRAAPRAGGSGTAEADGTPDGCDVEDTQANSPGSDDASGVAPEDDGGSSEDGTPTRAATGVSGCVDQSEAPGSVDAPAPSSDDSEDISPDSARHATDSGEHAEEAEPVEEVPGPQPEPEPEREVRPAHVEAPMEPDDHELDALVATARDAQERVADRESEQAARDAWEAEQTAAPEEEGSSGTESVDEASYSPAVGALDA